jgi:MraZ protein
MFFSSTDPVTPDAQGRLTLPPRLRNLLGMGRDVVVMGVSDHLEVWDGPAWDRYEQEHSMAYRSGALSLGGV